MIGTDSPKFLKMARLFQEGEFREALRMYYHPLYPLLVGYVDHISGMGLEVAATSISILLGSLGIVPLYRLAELAMGPKVAIMAAFTYAFLPRLVSVESEIMTEGLYIFLFLSALYLGWIGFRERSISHLACAGLLSGAAYLTRVEGLILLLVVGWGMVFVIREKVFGPGALKVAGGLLVFVSTFLLIASGFLLWVRSELGYWGYTTKWSARITLEDVPTYEHPPGRPERQKEWKKSLGELKGAVLFSLYLLLRSSQGLFIFLVPLVFSRKRGQGDIPARLFLASLILVYLLGLTLGGYKGVTLTHRHFLLPLVLGMPWLGLGMLRLIESRYRVPSLVLILLLVCGGLAENLRPRRYLHTAFKEAGKWLKRNSLKGAVVLSTKEAIGYYAQREMVGMRYRYDLVLKDCSKYKVNYVAFCRHDLRKMEEGFLERISRGKEFELVKVFADPLSKGWHDVYLFRYLGGS
jgi:4-amino-4-deoxy-L-arabinose transferase-like glycosyltransferase